MSQKALAAHSFLDTSPSPTPLFLTPNALHSLAQKLRPTCFVPVYEEVYALFPVTLNHEHYCLLFLKHSVLLLQMSVPECVSFILEVHHSLELVRYIKAMRIFFKKNMYKVPVAITTYALLPLESPKNHSAYWINPAQISAISETSTSTTLRLANHLRVASPIRKRSLKKRILLAFQCHYVIFQEFHPPETSQASPPVFELLSNTQFSRRFAQKAKNLQPRYTRGRFSHIYHQVIYHEGYRAKMEKFS
ncbi:MAG: competence protein ComK [Enterococcus sp.]